MPPGGRLVLGELRFLFRHGTGDVCWWALRAIW